MSPDRWGSAVLSTMREQTDEGMLRREMVARPCAEVASGDVRLVGRNSCKPHSSDRPRRSGRKRSDEKRNPMPVWEQERNANRQNAACGLSTCRMRRAQRVHDSIGCRLSVEDAIRNPYAVVCATREVQAR